MAGESRGSPIVTRLVIVVFLEWLGGTAVLPLLPLYLKNKGADPSVIGVVMAAYFVGGLVLQYLAGRLTDRFGRRPVLLGGLGAYALACLAFLLPLAPLAYGLCRFVQGGAAGAVEVATLATVSVVIPEQGRGRASSRIYSAMLSAAAIGPLLGAFVGVRAMALIFCVAAASSTVAAVPVLRTQLGEPTHQAVAMRRVTIDRRLVGAIAVAVAIGLVVGAYEACWTLLMRSKGASSFQLGLSWTLFALPYAVFFRVGGWAADRADRRALAAFGVVNMAAFCVAYGLLPTVDSLLAVCCFEAIGSTLALPATQSLLSEGADPSEAGRRYGLFATAQTAAMAASAVISGALFTIAPAVPFFTMGALGVGLGVLTPLAWRGVRGRVAAAT